MDYYLALEGDYHLTLKAIETIGPEEIYCNNDPLIDLISRKFPFAIVYKMINGNRYRISALDQDSATVPSRGDTGCSRRWTGSRNTSPTRANSVKKVVDDLAPCTIAAHERVDLA